MTMYRARIGMQENADAYPHHTRVPQTKSCSNHQDTITDERSRVSNQAQGLNVV